MYIYIYTIWYMIYNTSLHKNGWRFQLSIASWGERESQPWSSLLQRQRWPHRSQKRPFWGGKSMENLWKSGKYGKKMGKSSTNGKILGKSMEIYGRCVKKIGGKNMGNNGGKHDEWDWDIWQVLDSNLDIWDFGTSRDLICQEAREDGPHSSNAQLSKSWHRGVASLRARRVGAKPRRNHATNIIETWWRDPCNPCKPCNPCQCPRQCPL